MTTERRKRASGKVLERRFKAMRADGFSAEEADWYADRRISGVNMRRLRRFRRNYVASFSPEELEAFFTQMDDYIQDVVRPGKEVEDNIYSPGHEEIENVVALWQEMKEGGMRLSIK